MQTLISSAIVLIATLYIAKLWLPHSVKKHLMQMVGKTITTPSKGACGLCSSCGNCASTLPKSVNKVVIFHNK